MTYNFFFAFTLQQLIDWWTLSALPSSFTYIYSYYDDAFKIRGCNTNSFADGSRRSSQPEPFLVRAGIESSRIAIRSQSVSWNGVSSSRMCMFFFWCHSVVLKVWWTNFLKLNECRRSQRSLFAEMMYHRHHPLHKCQTIRSLSPNIECNICMPWTYQLNLHFSKTAAMALTWLQQLKYWWCWSLLAYPFTKLEWLRIRKIWARLPCKSRMHMQPPPRYQPRLWLCLCCSQFSTKYKWKSESDEMTF